MLLVVLAVTLGLVASSPIPNTTTPAAPAAHSADVQGRNSLNEMFEEVEELIGDTKSKLDNAVKELEAEESLKDHVSLKDLPPNYHNKTVKETKVGNATIVTKEEIIKETDNKTGSTYISKTIISTLKDGDKTGHPHPPHNGNVTGAAEQEWLSPMDVLNRLMCVLTSGERGCTDILPQILGELENPDNI